MRVKTWKIIDRGKVPEITQTVPYDCECGNEAELPVTGRPIAITGSGGIVFDIGNYSVPTSIQCRRCGRVYMSEIKAEAS